MVKPVWRVKKPVGLVGVSSEVGLDVLGSEPLEVSGEPCHPGSVSND